MERKAIIVGVSIKLNVSGLIRWNERQKKDLKQLNSEMEKLRVMINNIDISEMKKSFEDLANKTKVFKEGAKSQRNKWDKRRFYE